MRAARRDREDPERRPSAAQQLAGLALFAPLPIDTRRAAHEAARAEASLLRERCLDALDRHGELTADEAYLRLTESEALDAGCETGEVADAIGRSRAARVVDRRAALLAALAAQPKEGA